MQATEQQVQMAEIAAPTPAAQGDALPREDFAWLVVQEACETDPADEDDPECIRILRRDLKSAVLAALLRHGAEAALSAQAHEAAPTMDDAIAAGDGTLHGAIDHWMNRALDAERVLLSRGLVLEEAAKVCEEREQRFNREDARAACRLCAKGIRALADQINAAIDAAKGKKNGA